MTADPVTVIAEALDEWQGFDAHPRRKTMAQVVALQLRGGMARCAVPLSVPAVALFGLGNRMTGDLTERLQEAVAKVRLRQYETEYRVDMRPWGSEMYRYRTARAALIAEADVRAKHFDVRAEQRSVWRGPWVPMKEET